MTPIKVTIHWEPHHRVGNRVSAWKRLYIFGLKVAAWQCPEYDDKY